MTDVDMHPEPPVGSDERGPFSQPSILDLFKQEAQEIASAKSVDIPVKGYEKTGLRIRYGLPESGKLLDNIARKVMQEDKDTYTRNLKISMDTMVFLCQGLYVSHPENREELVEFDPKLSGAPVDLAHPDLGEVLGVSDPNPTGRQIIRKLFGNNEMAILNHAMKLNRWLQDTSTDINTELWEMGEA